MPQAAPRVRRHYLPGRFGQIHVRIASPPLPQQGKAPPLYCLHQSPKSSLEFEIFMSHAATDRMIVALDYPGYGQSDAPPEETLASIDTYAEAVWQVADALGHARLDLFGNHTGGKVATRVTRMRPVHVRAIAMISAAILTDAERAMFRHMFEPIPLDADGTRFTTTWTRIVERAGPGMTLQMCARSFLQTVIGGEEYEWGHKAAFDYGTPFEADLAEIGQRITVLNPADDLQVATRRAAGLLRNGEVIECPQWSYGMLDAHAPALWTLVRTRLDQAFD